MYTNQNIDSHTKGCSPRISFDDTLIVYKKIMTRYLVIDHKEGRIDTSLFKHMIGIYCVKYIAFIHKYFTFNGDVVGAPEPEVLPDDILKLIESIESDLGNKNHEEVFSGIEAMELLRDPAIVAAPAAAPAALIPVVADPQQVCTDVLT